MKRIFCLSAIILAAFVENCHSTSSAPWNINVTKMLNVFERPHLGEASLRLDKPRWYSSWSTWSSCQGGHKTRRKHCLLHHACGDAMRIEVRSCRESDGSVKYGQITVEGSVQPQQIVEMVKRHQEGNFNTDKTFKKDSLGFPPGVLGAPAANGAPPLDEGYTINETLPTPAPIIHVEDSSAAVDPPCGILGRYHGSAAERLRARMQQMVRIIGGRPAPPGKWPWQVAVLNRFKEAFCGGTLISLRWVVSAAHCVRKRLFVRLGEHDLLLKDYGEVEFRIMEALVHPHYDPDTVVNDVAMLRLPEKARPELGHGLACLPRPSEPLPAHTSCVILGWGKRRAADVHGTRLLHEAQISTIQQGVCRRSYWQYAITDNMVCAGRGRRDSCAGDSGGPLLCRHGNRYYLQGITSFGDGCGKRGKYGIYTRTSGYVPWIRSVVENKYFD